VEKIADATVIANDNVTPGTVHAIRVALAAGQALILARPQAPMNGRSVVPHTWRATPERGQRSHSETKLLAQATTNFHQKRAALEVVIRAEPLLHKISYDFADGGPQRGIENYFPIVQMTTLFGCLC
jgi:hypothetical protein